MKCTEVLRLLPIYLDLSIHDPQRTAIEQHIAQCEGCAEQCAVWSASEHWIADNDAETYQLMNTKKLSTTRVMDRIYDEQRWLRPIHQRSYVLSLRSRHAIMMIIAFSAAILLCVCMIKFTATGSTNVKQISGFVPITLPEGRYSELSDITFEVPVGDNISDFMVLHIMPFIPHYWIALGLFSVIVALLLLNWLMRVRQ